MNYSKTLRNNNRISISTGCQQYSGQCNTDLNLRFVLSGSESYHIGRRSLSVHPDSFLILNKGTKYSSHVDSDMPAQVFSINFDQRFMHDFKISHALSDDKLLSGCGFDDKIEYEFNETIYPFKGDIRYNITHLKAHIDQGTNDELLLNEYLNHCLLNYFSIYKEEFVEKAEKLKFLNTSTRVEILRRLNLAKEYLYSNYNQNVSLDDIAEHACLSVNHLLRTFKQAFNITPHQFLIQLRLQRAQLLLKTTCYPVNEVVNMIGFECPSSFTRLFKSRYKITPLKYRQYLLSA